MVWNYMGENISPGGDGGFRVRGEQFDTLDDAKRSVRIAQAERALCASEARAATDVPKTSICVIPANVAKIAEICAKHNGVFGGMSGVRVTVKGDCYELVATDGKSLAIVEGPSENADRLHLLQVRSPKESAIIPHDFFRRLRETTAIGIGEDESCVMMHAASPDMQAVSVALLKNVKDRFPRIDQIVPKGEPTFRFTVDPARLIDLLAIAKDIGNGDAVILEAHKRSINADTVLVLRCKSENEQTMLGMMVCDKEST